MQYFDAWLSAVIKVLMYPVVLIGIFATVLAVANMTIEPLEPESTNTIGGVIPIIMVMVLSIFLVTISPYIVTLLTGDLGLGLLTERGQGRLRNMRQKASGAAWRGTRSVVDNTANYMRDPAANTRQAVDMRAAQLNRVADRVARLGR